MNNQEKNTYVRHQITKALLDLMQTKTLAEISISEITAKAEVGRASFYRNYNTKKDILIQHDKMLIKEWGKRFESNPNSSIHNVFGSLFEHYKNHADFYLLLHHNHMTEIILETIKATQKFDDESDNREVYGKAFIAYGIYGWIVEWMARGMKESSEEINAMLAFGVPQE